MEGERVRGVFLESKAGREAVLAKVVIDCTGDGDVAFRAGVPCEKGGEPGALVPSRLLMELRATRMQ